MTALTTLLDGGKYYEAPRWHDGRLWFVDCLARTLLSTDTAGQCRTHATFEDDTPCGTGFLPDGRLIVLTMFRKRLLVFAEDKLSLYADLSHVATGVIDDMIVDGLGRAYVGDLGFNFPPPPDRGADGRIIQVAPDGATRVVAEGLRFPNGIAISPDHRRLVVAEMDGECVADYEMAPDGSLTFRRSLPCGKEPDGICLDQQRRGLGCLLFRGCLRSDRRPAGRSCSASPSPAAAPLHARSEAPTGEPCSASAPRPRMRTCGAASPPRGSTPSRWMRQARATPETRTRPLTHLPQFHPIGAL